MEFEFDLNTCEFEVKEYSHGKVRPALTKGKNMDIWVVGTSKSNFFKRFLN